MEKSEMSEEDKTYWDTVRARLEDNEKGEVQWVFDQNGTWKIARTNSGLVRYFEPKYALGVDPYGNANDIAGIVRISKRRTGARAAHDKLLQQCDIPQGFEFTLIGRTGRTYYALRATRWQRFVLFIKRQLRQKRGRK